MYCNQIFSILKKKIDPVIETPVEDLPIEESTSEENSEVSSSEENSESVSSSESEIVSEEITSEVIESEEPIEENSESESQAEPAEEITEDPEEIEESPTYVVANVIVCKSYEIASRIARCEFGESALAIDTTLYPVSIGDTYRDGVFYDSLGNVIERNLTESEQIEELTRKNKELNEIVGALLGLEG